MKLRMLPIARVFTKYQRTVRELAHALGKRARLELIGADTELDKVLLEQLEDPLLHLTRNAVDHGIELPAMRVASGKPEEGVITLGAERRGNQIVITVSDDGAGIDPERLRKKALAESLAAPEELAAMDDGALLDLIFRPGFSTAARVTEVSGRGVGMDVVRDTLTRMSGSIEVASTPGAGTQMILKLPLTLAIAQVLLVRVGGEELALPLDAVQRTLRLAPGEVQRVCDREVVFVGGEQVPLIWVADALELPGRGHPSQAQAQSETDGELPAALVEAGGQWFALAVERLLGKREIVLKSLGGLIEQLPCVAGATLLGDRVALVLDVAQVVQRGLVHRPAAAPAQPSQPSGPPKAAGRRRILLAEDSEVVRESLRRMLEANGYEVVAARDGAEALAIATRDTAGFDLVSTDVMMPNLDGYELTRALRASSRHKDVPIMMVTSRAAELDRVRGFDAGVDEYLTKPLDGGELLRTVERQLKRARS
jgi:two-component system chemotaxis sensor kinase CheA